MGRRVFLGGFTAGAVTVAVGSADTAAAAEPTTTFTGPVTAQKFYTNATAESAYFKTTSTDHATTVYQAATSGGGAALNVSSDNPDTSAMYLKGKETANGTLKITHVGHADGSDSWGSALSIDLQTAGTAAQGIYVIASAPTKGALLTLRNNTGLDDFVVKGTGLIGVGIDRGGTPRGQVHVVQRTKDPALVVQGVTHIADVSTPPTKIEYPAFGGGLLYAEDGALKWLSSNGGTPTTLAPR
jgi:hypothetical protein